MKYQITKRGAGRKILNRIYSEGDSIELNRREAADLERQGLVERPAPPVSRKCKED